MRRIKVVVVLGTRPEVIRLSRLIPLLDEHADLVLVHTGQNFDPLLNEIFFTELGLRMPDVQLEARFTTFATGLTEILLGVERVLIEHKPDVFLILGDTNSALSAMVAKKLQVPIFHIEAGNRAFDHNVPEEVNRRIVDGLSDFNLTYTHHSSSNLIREGFEPRRVFEVGSPMPEVISFYEPQYQASNAIERHGLTKNGYFLASFHRQETVDNPARLELLVESLVSLSTEWNLPILVSTHPRTRQRLEQMPAVQPGSLTFAEPFGFFDFLALQSGSKCVISDSGSISEEAAWLGLAAVTIRTSLERPEALDSGTIIMAGMNYDSISQAVNFAIERKSRPTLPSGYEVEDFSQRVLSVILSTYHSHREWLGLA